MGYLAEIIRDLRPRRPGFSTGAGPATASSLGERKTPEVGLDSPSLSTDTARKATELPLDHPDLSASVPTESPRTRLAEVTARAYPGSSLPTAPSDAPEVASSPVDRSPIQSVLSGDISLGAPPALDAGGEPPKVPQGRWLPVAPESPAISPSIGDSALSVPSAQSAEQSRPWNRQGQRRDEPDYRPPSESGRITPTPDALESPKASRGKGLPVSTESSALSPSIAEAAISIPSAPSAEQPRSATHPAQREDEAGHQLHSEAEEAAPRPETFESAPGLRPQVAESTDVQAVREHSRARIAARAPRVSTLPNATPPPSTQEAVANRATPPPTQLHAPLPEPRVRIGQIDVLIEAPRPETRAAGPASTSSIASRRYLRRF